MKDFDPVDMVIAILFGLYNIALVVAVVILCIHFSHWFPVLLLLATPTLRYKSKGDKDK